MSTRALLLSVAACLPFAAATGARAEIVLPDVPDAPAQKPAPGAAQTPGAKPPAAAAAAPAKAADAFGDRVRFAGGDSLRGSMVAFDAKTGLSWKHKDGLAPFQFKADHLDRVDLSTFAPKAEATDLRLTLNNGDVLTGRLVEFAAGKVEIDTWYAGRLSIPADTVRVLAPVKNALGAILSGFGKPADWKVQNGGVQQIRINDGQMTLTSNVWVGRELDLPAKYKVDLEVAGSSPSFMMAVMADGAQFYSGNSFMFQFNGQNGWINKCVARGNGSRNDGMGNFQIRQAEGPFRLSVFIDTEGRQMVVLANGQKVSTVAIPADFKPGKHLVLAGQNGNLKCTRLQVSPWSGQLEDAAGGAAKRLQSDLMVLDNKNQMTGELLGIKDGKASFKAEFAAMEVPLERIRNFELSGKNAKMPKDGKGAAQFWFNETDHLTLSVEAIKDGKVAGASAAFGPCAASLSAFQKAVFNLDAPFRAEAKKAEEGSETEDDQQ